MEEDIYRAEEEMLQRLEDTDPSTDDGRWGGDHCMHGTYIGTPCGADYICGLCEDGYTKWVSDPRSALLLGFGVDPAQTGHRLEQTAWRASEGPETAFQRVLAAAERIQDILGEFQSREDYPTLVWVVVQTDGGYWDKE